MKIIIGGSIGGLCTAIMLKAQGFDVEVYERSADEMRDRGAGLVIQPDMMEYLMENNIAPVNVFGVPAMQRQVLDETGSSVLTYPNDTIFTSWNYIWRQLKTYFPASKYFYGYELESIIQHAGMVTARFKNGEVRTAHLLVGADGYNSVVRQYVAPNTAPAYAGYVAYRGLVPESEMSREEIAFFAGKFSIFPYQIRTCYAIWFRDMMENWMKAGVCITGYGI